MSKNYLNPNISEQDFYKYAEMKEDVTFNLAMLTNWRIHNILNGIFNARATKDYESYYEMLESLYLEIEYKISSKPKNLEKNKELYNKLKTAYENIKRITSSIANASHRFKGLPMRGKIKPEYYQAFIDYELFLRKMLGEYGFLNPTKEDSRW